MNVNTVKFRRKENSKLEFGIQIYSDHGENNPIIDRQGNHVKEVWGYSETRYLIVEVNFKNPI